nr:hypothetical protein [Tanacetum cinerariifolium]
MFSTIKVVSRHQNTQQYGAMLPIELTNDEIRNTKAYKEYYAFATGEAAPKPKASARRKRSGSDTSTHISQPDGSGIDEGTGSKLGVPDVPTNELEEELSWNSSDDEGADDQEKVGDDDKGDKGNEREEEEEEEEEYDDKEDKDGDERDDDDEDQEVAKNDDQDDAEGSEDDDEVVKVMRSEDEGDGEENQGLNVNEEEEHIEEEKEDELYRDVNINQGRGLQVTQDVEDSHVTLTLINSDGQQESSSVSSQFVTNMLNPTSDADRLREEVQKENDEFLRTVDENIDENIKKIIKEQVKDQVKAQVSKILPRIEQAVNEQLKAEVLTRSSYSSRTSYAVAADLSEMELKKILIKKIEGNKSIQRSDAQRNLYKALVDAYESDKIILDTYGETVTLKRRHDDDEDKDEEPSAGSDRGSKRRREGKDPESASTPSEPATRSVGRSTTRSKSRQALASESTFVEEPVQTTSQMEEPSHPKFETGAEDQPIVQSSQHPEWFSQPKKPLTLDRNWNKTLPAVHGSIQPWISELAKQADTRSSFNELMDTPLDFSNFIMNRLRVDTLTPELLAGPTYDLVKGSCTSLIELKYHLKKVYKATTDQLDWVNPEGQQYLHNLLQPLPLKPDNRGHRVIPFAHFINNDLEYLRGGVSTRKYTTFVTKTKAADYGHINIVIQRRVEDLQLGVKSYQKRLNLTKPDTYQSDLNDGTLNDVRTALDDHLKGIRMRYLPQAI